MIGTRRRVAISLIETKQLTVSDGGKRTADSGSRRGANAVRNVLSGMSQ